MAIEHYKRRVLKDDTGIAGCACRGCLWYRKLREPVCDSAAERARLREAAMEQSREVWRFFDAAAARRREVVARNAQVAEPFRSVLNSISGKTA